MNYQVTDTREIATMTPGGGTKTEYRVWISTDLGATGYIDVPASAWNEDDLPEVLQAHADTLNLAYTVSA